tara:strand:+ start:5418 stop:6584 length:1167 start_codon:yes stop_codon:yes gene_type:complete
MIYSITASADTTLYEKIQEGPFSSSMNTGIDEILEINKNVSGSLGVGPFNSRFIVKFDIPATMHSGSLGGAFKNPDGTKFSPPTTFLKIYSANQDSSLALNDTLVTKAVSQSWDMGIGRIGHKPQTSTGASWGYPLEYGGTKWVNNIGIEQLGCSTHSIAGEPVVNTIITSASKANLDIRQDVSYWTTKMTMSSGVNGLNNIDNHGFLLKREDSKEVDTKKYGSFKYYSTETHTIYQPRLEFCWDDSKFNTGSLGELSTEDPSSIFLYLKNNRADYKIGEKAKFRIVGREKYPTKTYGNTSAELSVRYIPSGSAFYSVKDLRTGETVIPYDDVFTKMSCDSKGNYFEMLTSNLSPERYYQIEVKLKASGSTTDIIGYYPIKDIFKVTR